MTKRNITEYVGILTVCAALVLAYFRIWWLCIPLVFIWYFLFGFVGLAYTTSVRWKTSLSNFLLAITCPVLLVPFRKAFYYWSKAINITAGKPECLETTNSALAAAKRVNPDSLYSDNNRLAFFAHLAALYYDAGNKELCKEYFDKASALSNDAQQNVMLEKLSAIIEKE